MESIKPIGRSSDKSTGTFQIQQIRPLERNSKNVQRPQAKVQLDADDMPTPELLIDGRSKLTWLSDRLWRGVTDPLLRSLGTESIKTNCFPLRCLMIDFLNRKTTVPRIIYHLASTYWPIGEIIAEENPQPTGNNASKPSGIRKFGQFRQVEYAMFFSKLSKPTKVLDKSTSREIVVEWCPDVWWPTAESLLTTLFAKVLSLLWTLAKHTEPLCISCIAGVARQRGVGIGYLSTNISDQGQINWPCSVDVPQNPRGWI
ncbi:hypothetical protein T4B_9938 [Trichinella pseudospiralis]|uniref:Uncharacterized protein n=1 Tax=Trichinella pseudospiralis TaxID=6337 RepID=A0A0V1IFS8_TRIPS|nr:hypothetical protein T4A_10289 [Trichinella pseudospiralis]KRZ21608.1 hypothetical protein T4B_9938 [Trichinella pseudospiralis]KRZ42345.1 hypothetical protein T4C_4258 [Trichinella pseudospiralis]